MDNKYLLDELSCIKEELHQHSKSLSNIDKTLAVQAEQLKEHIRRSNLIEKHVDILEKKLLQDLEPVKDHVKAVNTILKVIGFISLLMGIVLAMFNLKDRLF
jgi:hypothetical protein